MIDELALMLNSMVLFAKWFQALYSGIDDKFDGIFYIVLQEILN